MQFRKSRRVQPWLSDAYRISVCAQIIYYNYRIKPLCLVDEQNALDLLSTANSMRGVWTASILEIHWFSVPVKKLPSFVIFFPKRQPGCQWTATYLEKGPITCLAIGFCLDEFKDFGACFHFSEALEWPWQNFAVSSELFRELLQTCHSSTQRQVHDFIFDGFQLSLPKLSFSLSERSAPSQASPVIDGKSSSGSRRDVRSCIT